MATWTSALSPGLAEAIRGRCAASETAAWRLIEALVNIDSSPEDRDGLERVVEIMGGAWLGLGFEVSTSRTAGGLPVLDARHPAEPAAADVLVLAHLDTVFPAGTVSQRPFQLTGDGKATGPGVADAKGAAVTAWLGISAALAATDGLPAISLRVLATTDEEAGSVQSRPLIERAAADADLALVFEPGRPDGSMVTRRRGARRYRIEVEGRAAHTGVAPWSGANAIEELAHKIPALQALNDRERFISVTVALIRGGMRINTVPAHAEIDVDVRIPDAATAEEIHAAIEAAVADNHVDGCSARWTLLNERPPMAPQSPGVDDLVAQLQEAARRVGYHLEATATGGGSDGAFTSALGVPTLDALGVVGDGYHTAAEFVTQSTLVGRAAAVGAFLAGLRRVN